MDKQLVKVAIVGNVDDGKSTFVGRLLYQTNSLLDDQLQNLEKISEDGVDFSLVTDGLKNERARKVTIDAAYRYFSTLSKRVVLIDCPGHFEYLKNMISGVSQADIAIVMVDITKGIQKLTKTHLKLASKLGPGEIFIAINKMDQVGYDQNKFEEIKNEVLKLCEAKVIPISALEGENINRESKKMPWAKDSLLSLVDSFQVQNHDDYRGMIYPTGENYHYLQTQTGEIQIGDELTLYPQNQKVKVKKLMSYDGDGANVIEFDQNINLNSQAILTDSKRGEVCQRLKIWGVWLSQSEKNQGSKDYILKSLANEILCRVRTESTGYNCYDNLQTHLELSAPGYFEAFENSKEFGSFVLLSGNQVVFAGIVEGLL